MTICCGRHSPHHASDRSLVIETPCLKICVLEPGSRLCRGCGRTLDEIAGWGAMSEGERRRVMALLPDRIVALRLRTGPSMSERATAAQKE
jgi:predicted Fe-S protein YdhL (DUF1289 family)